MAVGYEGELQLSQFDIINTKYRQVTSDQAHSLEQYYLGMVPRSISLGTLWAGSLSSRLSSSFRDTRDTSLFR